MFVTALVLPLNAFSMDLERKVDFKIPAQALSSALVQFSKQAHLQVVLSDDVDGQQTQGVSGQHPIKEALDILLQPAGLRYRAAGETMISVAKFDTATGTDTVIRTEREASQDSGGGKNSSREFRLARTTEGDFAGDSSVEKDPNESSRQNEENPRVELKEVVVTGTHIRGVPAGSSALITFDRNEIDESGATSIEGLLQKIPQNFGLVTGQTTIANGGSADALSNSARGASVDLRGLGAGSTLVLLNGERIAPSGQLGTFVDVSMLPLAAIERVEILSDGASAIYGGDAVAGVVNFVLRNDFVGAESSADLGASTEGGGQHRGVSQLLGDAWSGGSVMGSFDYADDMAVHASSRSYIPDQGGPYMVLPQQTRRTALVRVQQQITTHFDAFATGIYSSRDYRQDYASFGADVNEFGYARLSSGTVGIGYDFADGWRVQAIGNSSKSVNFSDSTIEGFPLPIGDWSYRFTSLDIRTDGPLYSLPGGAMRASVGAGRRQETLSSNQASLDAPVQNYDAQRYVNSGYAELFVPVIEDRNSIRVARRLEITLAARYDHYDDFGSATTPKVGVRWSPINSVDLRGTFTKSFRAPTLSQLSPLKSYIALPVTDPAGGPDVVTLVNDLPGNPALTAEKSTSFSAGISWHPAEVQGLALTGTYFDIEYRQRIDTPPIVGSFADVLNQEGVLGSFIQRNPPLADVQRIFSEEDVVNFVGATPTDTGAIFDDRLHNIGRTHTSGIDYSTEYSRVFGIGQMKGFLSGTYLVRNDSQPSSASDTVDLVNTTFNPMAIRFRTGIGWSRRKLGALISANYSGHYKDNLEVPPGRVSAWVTEDIQLSYSAAGHVLSSLSDGITLTLNVQNITNEKPPSVPGVMNTSSSNLNYDPTNATPLGRFVGMTLKMRW